MSQHSDMPLQPAEEALFRRLFLRRYALLLQKVEQIYPAVAGNPEVQTRLREKILNLTWVDVGVDRLVQVLQMRARGVPVV